MDPTVKLQLWRAVRERLSDPARWIKGTYARDSEGRSVLPDSPRAVCWCLDGAIRLEVTLAQGGDYRLYSELFHQAVGPINTRRYLSFVDWQDAPATTHKDVLDLVDTLIKEAEREASTQGTAL